jgi:hypothetical protein
LFAALRERLDLKLVGRQEFRTGAVALRYQPREVLARTSHGLSAAPIG